MNAGDMLSLASMQKKHGGFTLIETMIAVAVIGAAIALVLVHHRQVESNERVSGTVAAVSNMASKIRTYYRSLGSYNSLGSIQLSTLGFAIPPLTSYGGVIYDPWGSMMNMSGNAAGASFTFTITVGGGGLVGPGQPASIPLTSEECVSLATQLANGADRVNVGDRATVTFGNGLAGGGMQYKAVNGLSMANLIDAAGCGAAHPMIVFQYH
jgi:prepilin-type N-terminal cleavage/methylation domain-containing protein